MTDAEDPINWLLAQKVDRFVDIVFGGKHHLRKLEVNDLFAVAVPYGTMATIDDNTLTKTVFAAHELGLRVEVDNHGMRGIKLMLHSRKIRDGSIMKKHPTIVDALKHYGLEVVTKEEHEAAIAKLHAQLGCELRDTINQFDENW